MRNYLSVCVLILVGLSGCVTKEKCVAVDMLSDNSRMTFNTPGTSWFAITLGSANLEGKNAYRSCPGGVDPQWMEPLNEGNAKGQ